MDFFGYLDWPHAFFATVNQVLDDWAKPQTESRVEAPFLVWSKTDIAERGIELAVPSDQSWSCYREDTL